MKEHIQKTGVRKYAGDDLIELQAEPLKVIQAFFEKCGDCVINGCEIVAVGNKYDVKPGIVSLRGTDADGARTAKVVPFTGVGNVTLPIYLTLSFTVSERVYGDGKVKPVAYNYTAVASGTRPEEGVPFLEITDTGGKQFIDAIKVTEKLDKAGNGKDVTVSFAEAAARANIASGEKLTGLFGKVAKWFTDLKTVAWTGKYSDLAGVPASLPANGGNADTVGNLNAAQLSPCVKTDVANGFLVKTTIPEASNAMFVFQLTYNSYGNINAPVSITLQGYNYNVSGTIIETSAISTAQVPSLKLFAKDGLLRLWCDRLGNHTTLAASCQYSRFGTPSTPIPGNAAVEITDAPMPESGITRLVSVVPKVIWHNGNLTDAKDLTVSYAQSPDRVNLVPGETIALAFGKVKKWFADLKPVAWTGKYADLADAPASLPANGGNADTVGNLNVTQLIPCSKTDVANGFLVKTTIPVITNAMFVFQLTYNSYGKINVPVNITLQGYNYTGTNTITGTEAISTAEVPDLKLFIKDGLLHLWCNRLSDFTTLNVVCQYTQFGVPSTPVPGNAAVEITDAPMPESGITQLVSVVPKVIWSAANFIPAAKASIGYSEGKITGSGWFRIAKMNFMSGSAIVTLSNYYEYSFPSRITFEVFGAYRGGLVGSKAQITQLSGTNTLVRKARIVANPDQNTDLFLEVYIQQNTENTWFATSSNANRFTMTNPVPGSIPTGYAVSLEETFVNDPSATNLQKQLKPVALSGKYSDLTETPASLPANGGNADTVDGKHAADFATTTHTHPGTMIAKIIGEVDYAGGKVTSWGIGFSCEKSGTSTYTVTYDDAITNSFVMVTGGKGSNGTHTYASLMSKNDKGFVVATADDITGLPAGFHFVVYSIS